MTKIKIKVPATSANLGPGFDVLGVALQFYNEVTVEVLDGWSTQALDPDLFIDVKGEGDTSLPRDATNIIVRAAMRVFDLRHRWPRALKMTLLNRIPLSRGLGSSAAATLGGLCAANALLGHKLSRETLLDLATEMEGHPDNVTPALLGGFCVSTVIKGHVHYLKIPAPTALRAVVCSPERPLPTSEARAVLPQELPLASAVQNSSRLAFLVGALTQHRYETLRFAMEDLIHQPARAALIPGFNSALSAALKAGAWGAALSGAGSTVIAFSKWSNAAKIGKAMENAFRNAGETSFSRSLALDNRGVR